MSKTILLLDTNFLMIPFQFHVDIFSEIERVMDVPYVCVVLDKSIDELKAIQKQKGKEKWLAKAALDLVVRSKLKVWKAGKDYPKELEDLYADDVIEHLEGIMVATTDKELKRRLKAKKVEIVTLRSLQHLIKA